MSELGISSNLLMKSLSDDAKVLLGGYFGMLGIAGKSSLQFAMRESRPTARAQTALDELVEAGALARERLSGNGVKYIVQINCGDFGKWLAHNLQKGKWSATERITTPVGGSIARPAVDK